MMNQNETDDVIMRKKHIIKIFAAIITVILVAFLLSQVSIRAIFDTVLSIDPIYLILGLFLYFFALILRTLRFTLLMDKKVRFCELLPLVCVHNMMVNILPARSGEFTYVYLLKKIHAKTTGEGVATLIVARVFDFIGAIILLFVTGMFIQDIPKIMTDFLWIVYSFLFCLLGLLIALVYFGSHFIGILEYALNRCSWNRTRIGAYLLQKGDEIVDSYKRIEIRRLSGIIAILSLLIWLLSFGTLYIILIGIGISIPVQQVFFGAVVIVIMTVIPIHGVAGFGTNEAIWTLVYVPLGMNLNDAIISGFCYHIIILIYTCTLGMIGVTILKWRGHLF